MITYPFFSVIVPIYNNEKYLEECINSVIRQTFDSWELILVDDGSTDRSGAICDKYGDDPRIRVIHQDNSGELKARYNGLQSARGVYEIGLDSDDLLAENCLEQIKIAIDDTGCDLIMYAYTTIGDKKKVYRSSLQPNREYSQNELLDEVIANTNHSMWDKAIRTDIVKSADYTGLDTQIRFDLDCAQIIPIICKVRSFYVIDNPLYYYRIHQESISQASKPSHIMDTGKVTEFIIKVLKEYGLYDMEMQKKIYIAYLELISLRLMKMFVGKQPVSKKEIEEIQQAHSYVESRRYERFHFFSKSQYTILLLFRHRVYWLIRVMAFMYAGFISR